MFAFGLGRVSIHAGSRRIEIRRRHGRYASPEFSRLFRNDDLSPEIGAAWMHRELVRIHSFQERNGRTLRLPMSMPCLTAGKFPPVVTNDGRPFCYDALDEAGNGGLEAFPDCPAARLAEGALEAAARAGTVFPGGYPEG